MCSWIGGRFQAAGGFGRNLTSSNRRILSENFSFVKFSDVVVAATNPVTQSGIRRRLLGWIEKGWLVPATAAKDLPVEKQIPRPERNQGLGMTARRTGRETQVANHALKLRGLPAVCWNDRG